MNADLRPFGNLLARCRRDALRIIADDASNTSYRLALIGERLLAAFGDIDAATTLRQRLELIGGNIADADDVMPGDDSMLHLIWAHGLEWSAMRRGDEYIDYHRAPLYWCIGFVMLDFMGTDEAKPAVDRAFRKTFGALFEDSPVGGEA